MDVERLQSYAEKGYTRKEIAAMMGLPKSTVSNYCSQHGIKTKRPVATLKRIQKDSVQKTLDLRKEGLSYHQISGALGISLEAVANTCRRYNLGGKIIEQRLTESMVADLIDRSGFDYVGGYVSAKKPVTVRCRICGGTFDRQFHIFRDVVSGTWKSKNECPLCKEQQRREKVKNRMDRIEHDARIKAEQRAKKEADLISRQLEERLAIHVCKNCGAEYCIGSTGYNSKRYCSKKCMKRWAMRIKNDRRVKRMKTRTHDTDITLEKLFSRDGGVCYLCGNACDWADVQDGNAGDTYPSIDHVKPLSKGGAHTWENIRLAHRRCNWEKGSLI